MLALTSERPRWPPERRVDSESAAVDVARATIPVGDPTGDVPGAAADPVRDTLDPDRAAVDEARTGSAAAFEALVVRYQVRIVNYAAAMVHDLGVAEDVAQDTFVRAWSGLGRFRGESSFKTWLYRIATNVARTHLDRRGRQVGIADQSLDDDAARLQAGDVPSAAPDAEAAFVTREAIDGALARLPEEFRLALVLRDVEGLDYKEIAAVTGAPIGTVESRIFRARRRVRTLLQPLVGARRASGAPARHRHAGGRGR